MAVHPKTKKILAKPMKRRIRSKLDDRAKRSKRPSLRPPNKSHGPGARIPAGSKK
jgi:hypothetical protein